MRSPCRKRSRARPSSDRRADLPGEGTPTLAGVELPQGGPRPEGGDEFFWATEEAVPDPGRLAAPLADAYPTTGLWPVLWEWDENPASYFWQRPSRRTPDGVEPERVFELAWQSYATMAGVQAGPFPGPAESAAEGASPVARSDPFGPVGDDAGREPWQPARRLLLVPCARPADALAELGWDFSEVPAAVWSIVLRSWEERFAAVLVQLEPSAITLHVGAPPTAMAQAKALAAEMAAVLEGELGPGSDLTATAKLLLTGKPGDVSGPLPQLEVRGALWRFAFREYGTDALVGLAPEPS